MNTIKFAQNLLGNDYKVEDIIKILVDGRLVEGNDSQREENAIELLRLIMNPTKEEKTAYLTSEIANYKELVILATVKYNKVQAAGGFEELDELNFKRRDLENALENSQVQLRYTLEG